MSLAKNVTVTMAQLALRMLVNAVRVSKFATVLVGDFVKARFSQSKSHVNKMVWTKTAMA